jgi:cytochrome c oxidase assembly factor CtaG
MRFWGSLMGLTRVSGDDFYHALVLPFVPDLLVDQQTAGAMAWAAGEIPMVVVLIALLVQWARADEREAADPTGRRMPTVWPTWPPTTHYSPNWPSAASV